MRGESLAAAWPRRGSPVEEGEDDLQRASMDGGAIDVGPAIVADIVDVARVSHGSAQQVRQRRGRALHRHHQVAADHVS